MGPEPEPTDDLLRRAGDGDPSAMNDLLDGHREALRRMIGLRMDPMLARRVDASDIVQDVLLKASRRLAEYLKNPTMPFALWLRHLAKDHLIDEYRKHRLAGRRSLDREQPIDARAEGTSSLDVAAVIPDRDLTPAAAALRAELQRRFDAAIQRLDEADREVILMRHYEQLGNGEVARLLGLSEPAAGMRHLRALRRLRALLGGPETGGE
ncbi:MAG: sigma-70 family RNA polymerase sigma factor [Isosphaeraceae bacterium]